jgi:tRNA nucleotidyltransferase/poly(A) polymerase
MSDCGSALIDGPALEARVPPALVDCAGRLKASGHRSWLVGESLHALLRGETPSSFELATSASPEQVLGLFRRAVPTRLLEGCVALPTPAGPVDLEGLRNGSSVEADLAHRAFTFHALAFDLTSGQLLDPFEGRRDLERGLLRAVGSAAERLAESPLRAIRAARLVSVHGYQLDGELEAALAALSLDLRGVPALELRSELAALLLGVNPAAAIRVLRQSGIEAVLLGGARDDAGALVEALPAELLLRLTAWLRGANAARFLRQIRFGLARSERVLRLLQHHPIDRAVRPDRDPSLRRLLRQLGPEELEALFLLRERELGVWKAASPERCSEIERASSTLAALRGGIDRVRDADARRQSRQALALDGRAAMLALGCGPGRRVGQALRHLARLVEDGVVSNRPEDLRAELESWAADHPE